MLHARMPQRLARHAAIAAADDQHPLRRAMGEDRHMRHHLVIDELVALGDLHDAVQRELRARSTRTGGARPSPGPCAW
jgi:hypothetical protein